jgi:hypothetical protein
MPRTWLNATACLLIILFCAPRIVHADQHIHLRSAFLPVGLVTSFTATSGDRQVLLEWQVASDEGLLGFYVWRGLEINEEVQYQRIETFIPIQESVQFPQEYSFVDLDLINDITYYYRLELISLDESSDFNDPISATPHEPQPTPTHTVTSSLTPTQTPTETQTPTATVTRTITSSPTATHTPPPPPTTIPSATPTLTATVTLTPSITPTVTITRTPMIIYRTPSRTPSLPFITITINPPLMSGTSTQRPSERITGPSSVELTRISEILLDPTITPKAPFTQSTRSMFWILFGLGSLLGMLILLGGTGLYLMLKGD